MPKLSDLQEQLSQTEIQDIDLTTILPTLTDAEDHQAFLFMMRSCRVQHKFIAKAEAIMAYLQSCDQYINDEFSDLLSAAVDAAPRKLKRVSVFEDLVDVRNAKLLYYNELDGNDVDIEYEIEQEEEEEQAQEEEEEEEQDEEQQQAQEVEQLQDRINKLEADDDGFDSLSVFDGNADDLLDKAAFLQYELDSYQRSAKKTRQTLWQDVVGDTFGEVDHLSAVRISYVSKACADKLFAYDKCFLAGINLKNCPQGFSLSKASDVGFVLDFDATKAHAVNPLGLSLQHEPLMLKRSTTITAILAHTVESFADKYEDILAKLKLHIHKLNDITFYAGQSGLNIFLHAMATLQDAHRFDDFFGVFLEKQITLSAFVPEAKLYQQLHALTELNDNDYHWFITLCQQQRDAGATMDFTSLYAAFEYFVTQLTEIDDDLALPPECPVTGVRQVQVALDRILGILQLSTRPHEQLRLLKGNQYSTEGATVANWHHRFASVAGEMHLTPQLSNALKPKFEFPDSIELEADLTGIRLRSNRWALMQVKRTALKNEACSTADKAVYDVDFPLWKGHCHYTVSERGSYQDHQYLFNDTFQINKSFKLDNVATDVNLINNKHPMTYQLTAQALIDLNKQLDTFTVAKILCSRYIGQQRWAKSHLFMQNLLTDLQEETIELGSKSKIAVATLMSILMTGSSDALKVNTHSKAVARLFDVLGKFKESDEDDVDNIFGMHHQFIRPEEYYEDMDVSKMPRRRMPVRKVKGLCKKTIGHIFDYLAAHNIGQPDLTVTDVANLIQINLMVQADMTVECLAVSRNPSVRQKLYQNLADNQTLRSKEQLSNLLSLINKDIDENANDDDNDDQASNPYLSDDECLIFSLVSLSHASEKELNDTIMTLRSVQPQALQDTIVEQFKLISLNESGQNLPSLNAFRDFIKDIQQQYQALVLLNEQLEKLILELQQNAVNHPLFAMACIKFPELNTLKTVDGSTTEGKKEVVDLGLKFIAELKKEENKAQKDFIDALMKNNSVEGVPVKSVAQVEAFLKCAVTNLDASPLEAAQDAVATTVMTHFPDTVFTVDEPNKVLSQISNFLAKLASGLDVINGLVADMPPPEDAQGGFILNLVRKMDLPTLAHDLSQKGEFTTQLGGLLKLIVNFKRLNFAERALIGTVLPMICIGMGVKPTTSIDTFLDLLFAQYIKMQKMVISSLVQSLEAKPQVKEDLEIYLCGKMTAIHNPAIPGDATQDVIDAVADTLQKQFEQNIQDVEDTTKLVPQMAELTAARAGELKRLVGFLKENPDFISLSSCLQLVELENANTNRFHLTCFLTALREIPALNGEIADTQAKNIEANFAWLTTLESKSITMREFYQLVKLMGLHAGKDLTPGLKALVDYRNTDAEDKNRQTVFREIIKAITKLASSQHDVAEDSLNGVMLSLASLAHDNIAEYVIDILQYSLADAHMILDKIISGGNESDQLLCLRIAALYCATFSAEGGHGDNARQAQAVALSVLLLNVQRKSADLKAKLNQFFVHQPVPDCEALFNLLSTGKSDEKIEAYLDAYEAKLPRDEAALYTEAYVEHVISTLLDNATSDADRQAIVKSRNQFLYMNAMAQHTAYGLPIDGVQIAIKDLTRSQMKVELARCRAAISGKTGDDGVCNDYLTYLALLREVMFRTTGKHPYSTQILDVLLALNTGGDMLFQIDTGEGKSITASLFAAVMNARGETVDVSSANTYLAERDHHGKRAFYDYLDIKSTYFHAGSKAGTYIPGGVNYSDIANNSLYRSRAFIEGEDLSMGRPTSAIIDEADFCLLDQFNTQYNFSKNLDMNSSPDENIYAEFYTLINDFVDNKALFFYGTENVADDPHFVKQHVDIHNLRKYLDKHCAAGVKDLLKKIGNETLDTWLESACVARKLIQDKHFIVTTDEKVIKGVPKMFQIAQILVDQKPAPGAKWSQGVQQLLHARLDAKRQRDGLSNIPFRIDPENFCVASVSNKNIVDGYLKNGQVIGMTGSLGTEDERRELCQTYGFKTFTIPSHFPNKRHQHQTKLMKPGHQKPGFFEKVLFGRDAGNQLGAIKDAIATADKQFKQQPVVIVCRDIKSAEKYFKELQGSQRCQSYQLQLVTGKESDLEACVERAGVAGMITVTTPLLGRGTDISPLAKPAQPEKPNARSTLHPSGLFVLATFIGSPRLMRQVAGRCARNGHIGYYQAIYNQEELPLENPTEVDVAKLQDKMNQRDTIVRHYTQTFCDVKYYYQQQFDAVYAVAESEDDNAGDKHDILLKKQDFNRWCTRAWHKLLNAEAQGLDNLYCQDVEDDPFAIVEREGLAELQTEFNRLADAHFFEIMGDAANSYAKHEVTENKRKQPLKIEALGEQFTRNQLMLFYRAAMKPKIASKDFTALTSEGIVAAMQELFARKKPKGLSSFLSVGGRANTPFAIAEREFTALADSLSDKQSVVFNSEFANKAQLIEAAGKVKAACNDNQSQHALVWLTDALLAEASNIAKDAYVRQVATLS